MYMEKKKYYKAVCEEYPKGLIHENKEDAMESSKECRSQGERAYVRAIKMTEEDFNNGFEV